MLNYANLEAVKYYPELLPSAEYCNPVAGITSDIMNLTRLPAGMLVRLKYVGAERSDDAQLRLKADSEAFNVPSAAIPDLTEPTEYDLLARSSARLQVHAIGDLSAVYYKTWHGLWAWKATIAEKLILGITLTAEEKAINEKLGVYKTVERGTLPIVWDRTKMYEYYPIYIESRTLKENVPITGLAVDTIRPRKLGDQFVVLEKVSCGQPGAVGHNVQLTIWRDDDGSAASPLITLNAYVFETDLAFDIPMWIPALREINLRVECTTLQTDYLVRYTFGIYRMTSILRARWFGEGPAELVEKAKGGII